MSIFLGAAKLINTLSVLTGMSCYKLRETRDAVIEEHLMNIGNWKIIPNYTTSMLIDWTKLLLSFCFSICKLKTITYTFNARSVDP